MSDEVTTKDVVTLALALWGAGLSTLLAARQVLRDKPKVAVTVQGLFSQPPVGSDDDDYREYIWLRIVNLRARPIEIERINLHFESVLRNYAALPTSNRWRDSTELPVVLQDGERADIFYDRARVAEPKYGKLRSVTVTDVLGREFTGRFRWWTPGALLFTVKMRRMQGKDHPDRAAFRREY